MWLRSCRQHFLHLVDEVPQVEGLGEHLGFPGRLRIGIERDRTFETVGGFLVTLEARQSRAAIDESLDENPRTGLPAL